MSRRWGLLLALSGALAAGAGAPELVRRLAELESFRVTSVELVGGRYLTLEAATLAASVPPEASVWDDATEWEARLAAHPLVRGAEVRRRLPRTLVLVVDEREPVGLAPTPTLAPVDREGVVLPLDPAAHAMDLPLLSVDPSHPAADALRAKLAAEAARLSGVDAGFLGRVSELALDERGDLVARWGDPPVTFRFRAAVPAWRLREGALVLGDAAARAGGLPPATVDLRFADQVVVRGR